MSQQVLRSYRRPASLVLAAIVLGLWTCAALAEVSARFDRNEVHEGETVQLVIESNRMAGDGPDLSVLGADFEVRGTATSSQIQIINGRQSATRSWQIVLMPKRTGVIDLPPIPVGDEQTSPLRLTVSDAPQGAVGGAGDDVFLEIEVGGDQAPVYVQQQLPVTVRLFTALPLRMGEISEPRPEGAVVERLGEDLQYQTTRQGREYQVIERRYSLSPERSGELRIPPLRFSGELQTTRRGGASRAGLPDIFRDPVFDRFASGVFSRGEPVSARTGAVTLDVQPVPDGFESGHWLPARALAIDDSWAREPPSFANGEPVSRVLTTTATGLSGSQLPKLDMSAPDGVRVYGEPAEAETRTDGKSLFGVSRQQFTLIPARDGALRFPEVRLTWFDLDSGEERVAVVPARVFGATGAVRPAPADAGRGLTDAGLDSATAHAGDGSEGAAAQTGPVPRAGEPRRPWFLLPLLLGLVLLWLLWSRRRVLARRFGGLSVSLREVLDRLRGSGRPGAAFGGPARRPTAGASTGPARAPASATPSGSMRASFAGVRAAAADNDAPACARALLVAAHRCWPDAPPSSLGEIAARLDQFGDWFGHRSGDPPMAAQARARARSAARSVRVLDASLYGPSAADWSGAELAEAVPAVLAEVAKQEGGHGIGDRAGEGGGADLPLPPLYPRRG